MVTVAPLSQMMHPTLQGSAQDHPNSGKDWAPAGMCGTCLSVEITSDVKSTSESSLGKGISENLTTTLKIRQAPGVP